MKKLMSNSNKREINLLKNYQNQKGMFQSVDNLKRRNNKNLQESLGEISLMVIVLMDMVDIIIMKILEKCNTRFC